jgi:hypothetical protein
MVFGISAALLVAALVVGAIVLRKQPADSVMAVTTEDAA